MRGDTVTRLLLPMIAALWACDGAPLAPDRPPAFKASSIVTVSARTQLVVLEFGSGETARASFKARFYASTSPDPAAQMDGAILVVSAADGPMPQIGGESLAIEVAHATINRAGVVEFDGTGIVSMDRVVLYRYPITGSARSARFNPDCLIIDIVGGDSWKVHFEALGKISG
jgi:hypothetical protein